MARGAERAAAPRATILEQPAPPSPDCAEADFQALVAGYARALGYEVYHTRDSRGSESGFPDLTIVGHGRILFVELKARTGRLSPAQYRWARAIVQAGSVWRCWRPCAEDWQQMIETLA